MDEVFHITAINPATGKVVKMTVRAETEMDAEQHAESCGLLHPVARGSGVAPFHRALPYWLQDPAIQA